MPVDVQWFIYALISNGALSAEDAVAIYNSIGEGCTLESYAQVVLEQMAAGISEEEAQTLLEQIQEIVNYAVAQGETGTMPPLELFAEEEAVETAAPAPVARQSAVPPRRGGAVPPPKRSSGAAPSRRGGSRAPQTVSAASVLLRSGSPAMERPASAAST